MPKRNKRIKFTTTGLDRMKPPTEGREVFSDTLVPGLQFRITDRGVKSFSIVTRLNGTQIRVTLGQYPDNGIGDVREKAREAKKLAKQGIDPRPQDEPNTPDPDTVGVLFNGDPNRKPKLRGYLKHRQERERNRTWPETRRIFESYILPAVTGDDSTPWTKRSIKSVSKRDIIELLDGHADHLYQHNRILSELRSFFGWCDSRGILDTVPSFRKLAKDEISRSRTLGFDVSTGKEDHDEIKAFWASTESYPFGLAYRLALVTGKRRSEVAGLEEMELDLDGGKWTIPARRAKNGKVDTVHLSDTATVTLEAALAERRRRAKTMDAELGPFVFSTTHGQKSVNSFSKSKASLDKAMAEWLEENAGRELVPWRLHDLRRTIATYLEELEFSDDVIKSVLNHVKGGGVTARYKRNPLSERKAQAMQAWANKLRAIVTPAPDKTNIVPLAKRQ